MKLIINDYEVTITAKYKYNNRANKRDTAAVLNTMSIFATEASNHYTQIGMHALAKTAEKVGSEIFHYLDEQGVYDHLK